MSKKIRNYNLGFPRIGENRELKFALEAYWSGKIDIDSLQGEAKKIRARNFELQKDFDVVSANDFSFYDGMLDMIFHLGAYPSRFEDIADKTDRYFAMARGDAKHTSLSMLKWFNTNYHYLVPELDDGTAFAPDAQALKSAYIEAKSFCDTPKINIVGPVTFFALSSCNSANKDALFEKLLGAYEVLVSEIAAFEEGIIIQIDEPIVVCGADSTMLKALKNSLEKIASAAKGAKIAVATYFEHATEALPVLSSAPIWAVVLDFVYGAKNIEALEILGRSDKVLIAGVIDGKNVWSSDIKERFEFLASLITKFDKQRLILSPSCSLLHLPYSSAVETKLDSDVKSWLAFAVEKTKELKLLSKLFYGETLDESDKKALADNEAATKSKKTSAKTADTALSSKAKEAFENATKRAVAFGGRIAIQNVTLKLPPLPTTTIGSFPQTPEVRGVRASYKKGELTKAEYDTKMKEFIKDCVALQEEIGLDVLVHGEFERNDMVEYFGELLDGVAVSSFGWVQSYGSRCVKPPIVYGNVVRKAPMTVEWSSYAQSLTSKPMKGMLTGPVTLMNWSFERNDIPKSEVCAQLALAVRDEVIDLQNAGINVIQVDEAAFKEGYPLRNEDKKAYEDMALRCFWISTSTVKPTTQIHTHMCYSVFDDIMDTIEAMDADVITIETAKAGNRLLRAFESAGYKKEIGPGIYDIHSPRVPSVNEMLAQIDGIMEVLPPKQVWINPDCGLKTRKDVEVKASLVNMVRAATIARDNIRG